MSVAFKTCRLCGMKHNILNQRCSRCGCLNEQFYNMPENTRDAFVEFYHDREVFLSMEEEAIRQKMSVEELYKTAAEFYLEEKSKRRRGKV